MKWGRKQNKYRKQFAMCACTQHYLVSYGGRDEHDERESLPGGETMTYSRNVYFLNVRGGGSIYQVYHVEKS